jgi:hypothetical protein
MIMSVSTLTIGSGAATPRKVVNFSMGTPRKARNKRGFSPKVKMPVLGPIWSGGPRDS